MINIGVSPEVGVHVSYFLNTLIPGNYSFCFFSSPQVNAIIQASALFESVGLGLFFPPSSITVAVATTSSCSSFTDVLRKKDIQERIFLHRRAFRVVLFVGGFGVSFSHLTENACKSPAESGMQALLPCHPFILLLGMCNFGGLSHGKSF